MTPYAPADSAAYPLITVITAVYNGAAHLEETILSVLGQTYPRVEYIVVDGGSTDGSVDIIGRYADRLAYWTSQPDAGIYEAWNKGLARATGDWIGFLGSDDCLLADALASYVAHIAAQPHPLDYVSARIHVLPPDRHPARTWGSAWSWPVFSRHMNVAHVGSLHHRQLYERYGTYDTSYRIAGDYELLLRAKDQLRTGFLDQVTARVRAGGASTRVVAALNEAVRAKRHTGRSRLARWYDWLNVWVHYQASQMRRSLPGS